MKCSVQLVLQCLFCDVVASCVVCLLNIPATDKMLQLRTCKNYWNIFVASWRRQQLCLRQLRPRPLTLKSRTGARSRSRIWRSPIPRKVGDNDTENVFHNDNKRSLLCISGCHNSNRITSNQFFFSGEERISSNWERNLRAEYNTNKRLTSTNQCLKRKKLEFQSCWLGCQKEVCWKIGNK